MAGSITETLSDTWVTVSDEEDVTPNDDNICNEVIHGMRAVITVQCNYRYINAPRRGRYVTIRRKDDALRRNEMLFCEVEVMSCPPGRWGYNVNSLGDCVYDCDRCRNISETCRVSDGHCYTAFKDEFIRENCDEQCDCDDGASNDNNNNNNNHGNRTPCDQTDGSCGKYGQISTFFFHLLCEISLSRHHSQACLLK